MIQGNYVNDDLLLEQEREIMREKLTDILVAISWREIARTYFNKSAFPFSSNWCFLMKGTI